MPPAISCGGIKKTFVPWVVRMCNMVNPGEKNNILEPRNYIGILLSYMLDLGQFDPKMDKDHLCRMGSPYVRYGESN
jgi:hypothetical protein